MDPQYARWVKAAALSATALASILLIIKIFCLVAYRFGEFVGGVS